MVADYPFFDSFASVVRDSDVVIAGTFLDSRSMMVFPDGGAGSDPSANPQAGADLSTLSPQDRLAMAVPTTVSRVKVTESLAGGIAPGTVIEVSQDGGVVDGVKYREQSTSLLSESGYADYVLVLTKNKGAGYRLVDPVMGALGRRGTAVQFLKPALADDASAREIGSVADVVTAARR